MPEFAPLPDPPYYAGIFANQASATPTGYAEMADAMVAAAKDQPGYIGIDSTRGADGFGITVSYWHDEKAMADWKAEAKHLLAQKLGKERWYDHYTLRVAKVERQYEGPEGR